MSGIRKYCEVYGIKPENTGGKFLISPFNLKYLVQTIQGYIDEGKPVIAAGIDRDAVWTDEDVAEYEKVISEVANLYIRNIGRIHRIDLFVIPLLDYEYSSSTYCGAGRAQWGIAPNGDIYPCQRFYNNRSPFILGNVFDGLSGKWNQMFTAYNANCFRACTKCDVFTNFNCLGPCIAACYENGDIFKCIPNVCKILKITYGAAKHVDGVLKGNPIYDAAMDKVRNYKYGN
jgi:radical SAM protein with 4Fe4S-binding SPASM domain